MTDPNEMTAAELAAVIANAEAAQSVPMRHPVTGRTVSVTGHRVPERLAAGYTRTEN